MKKSAKGLTLSSGHELDAFIEELNKAPATLSNQNTGRILFALDATASRQRTWDHACHLQNEMFIEAGKMGGLELKLSYFRGFNEFSSSKWLSNSEDLLNIMNGVRCSPGHTQISKVLDLALTETRQRKIQAVIFIGDCMEESLDHICQKAGELGLLSTPVFTFQEGNELVAKRAMKEIARLSGGAYHAFNARSAHLLKQLLAAVAVYAAGGKKALQHYSKNKDKAVLHLLEQLK
ncbi:MAG: VWA domain-containing protein [Neptuniibacter sp.]